MINPSSNNHMKTNPNFIRTIVLSLFAAGAGLLLSADTAKCQTGSWTSTATGNWSDSTKWLGGIVADGVGSTAYFTNDITADVTVHLDSARTNGSLVFGDGDASTPANWFLDNNGTAGNILTLSGPTPAITVNALGAANLVNIGAVISGSNLTESGPGLLVPSGANTFTNMIINGGRVVWNTANGNGSLGASTTNNIITLTNGATIIRSNTANNLQFTVNVKGTDTIDCSSAAANAGNLNGLFIGDGTMNIVLGVPGVNTNTLTTGGNIVWNSNIWANFSGTVVLNGGGNLRFDINNANTFTFGSKLATFDLGTTNNTMNERAATSIAQHTTFLGALKGGSATVVSCNGKAGDTNTFQVGDNNLSTTFSGTIKNPNATPNPWTALTKSGTGTLTLDGTNLYSGITLVQGGKLALSAAGSISNTPAIVVLSNALFDVSAYGTWTAVANQILAGNGTLIGNIAMGTGILSPGLGNTIGRLTFANDLALQGNIVNMKIGNGTNDSVAVGGNLNLSGTTTINVTPPAGFSLIPNSTNVLFSWGGALSGDLNNLQLSYPAQSASAVINLITNMVAKQISLIVVSNKGNQVVWKGNIANNVWDRSTANWLNGASTVVFTNLDDVAFNDSGVASVPVNVGDVVTPASIVISNNSSAYTFNGGGQIAGVTTLVKNGTNSLTVLEDNSFSGTVSVNAGSIVIGNGPGAGSLGSGSLLNNATVVYNRDTILTLGSPLQGSGTLVQNSTNGTMVLTADNSNPGNIWVEAGTLQMGSGNVGGISGSFTGTITNSATLTYIYDSSRTIPNSLAGNGVVNYTEVSGNRLYTFPLTPTSGGFTGTMNIVAGVSVHADTLNMGYQFGNGSTVNVPFLGQAWLDTLATNAVTSNYNNAFVIQGTGWSGDPLPIGHVTGDLVGLGALRIFNCTLTGPITLLGDTRLGSSSSGGTIQGQISDGGNNYQLEIVTSSANLDNAQTLAPTGGPNPFGRLLVTSGTIQAGSTNAFTNAVTMAAWGRMRLNGYNLTIASLSGGTPVGTTNCYVYNYNRTNPATLTVGTDASSQQFDGIFADGTNQPLGVVKVGAGTWTLTANSTNTGAVSVKSGILTLSRDGSFSNSVLFAVSSGATLNVNARSDGTLTLNSGQTLSGSGNVTGKVNALAGSTVSPGSSIGTLNVLSDLTLAGTLLMELNRTNGIQTNDLINVAGAFTSTSGTLVVTNIGPALAVGNFFQLFSGGRSFAAVNLQTNDTVNNVKYTWNNTVNSNGRITVATVTGLVNTAPTNITAQVVGGTNLNLSWPSDHTGWTLQSQTNSTSAGLKTNWVDVAGSAGTNQVTIPITATNGCVFFRMKYP